MLKVLLQSLKIVTIAFTALLVLFGGTRAFDYYRDETARDAKLGQSVLITIKKSDEPSDVAKELHDLGLINSELYFTSLVRFSGKEIKPASYSLKKGMSTRTIVDLITTEKSEAKTSNKELTITVPEGWRTEQIAEELERLGLNGGYDAFMDAVRNYDGSQFDFLDDRPDKRSLEGYLFPDTYTFKADMPPEDIIQMMLQNFDAKMEEPLRKRAEDMGLTINEVLVLASLVEREAKVNLERPIIAGVYINRVEQGINLEADPTVQYVLGKRGDWWPKIGGSDLEKTNSPYNTYKNGGFPPGPICNPGLQSILGVLQPADTDYIYFVVDPNEDGTHVFAADFDSQQQNVAYFVGDAEQPAPCSIPFVDDCGYIRSPE